MKKLSKYFILVIIAGLIVGCASKDITYDEKNVVVESVFDDLNIQQRDGEVESVFDYLASDTIVEDVLFVDERDALIEEDNEYPKTMASSDLLRLRAEGSIDSYTIKLLQPGEEVIVLEDAVGVDGIFSRVSSGEDIGFVATEFLIETGILPVYNPDQ